MNRTGIMFTVILAGIIFYTVQAVLAQTTQKIYLSGYGNDDAIPWEFYCTGGRNSGAWTTIPVPSHWEFHGFGTYHYGHAYDKDEFNKEQGIYRKIFTVPASWAGKRIRIVFEGSMTDTEVSINGKSAGPKHQGSFYRFKYDITELIRIGTTNLLEVTVSKKSSNNSVNLAERKADYWIFGGIYRPVYLEVMPSQFIDWTAIDAHAEGMFSIDVYLKYISSADNVTAQIFDVDGSELGGQFSTKISINKEKVTLRTKATGHKKWSAETPNLYKVELTLGKGKTAIHTVTERFGFRTIELHPGEGIFLNGSKICLKGVNRHSSWPNSGRCLSREISYNDVRLIKQMNMNAVRMSHYPPDVHFLEACDELGLYVLDELAGWQRPAYDTEVGEKLVKEMVVRDVNHPSILFWDNGNEGGWNFELDDDFALYDPQKRTVIHPSSRNNPPNPFNNIDTDHYESYAGVKRKLSSGTVFMPTEHLHGLYDGGHGAGLNDFWKLMRNSPLGAGAFLWVFADEGVVRTDKNGWIDVDGNHAPDGILGPYREREGSFYTIKEIWSPVQIDMETLPADFDGTVTVENHYDFRNLHDCSFEWQFVDFHEPRSSSTGHEVKAGGRVPAPFAQPGSKATIKIDLPENWKSRDAFYLSAIDYTGEKLWTWTWSLKKPIDYLKTIIKEKRGKVIATEKDDFLILSADKLEAKFEKTTGKLARVRIGNRELSFGNGPNLVKSSNSTSSKSSTIVTHKSEDSNYVLEVKNAGGFEYLQWKMHASGLLELNYRYQLSGELDFFGITFDCPENQMLGMKWLGKGPYRVWKNRMMGTMLDVWQRYYNDTMPGELWQYPEFKGYYANMHWVVFQTRNGPITVATDTENLFFRVYTPRNGEDPRYTAVSFPRGDISFLHAIPPIGTKFKSAKEYGPESQKNKADGIYEGNLYFRFGD